jgi:putative oxidoreductase
MGLQNFILNCVRYMERIPESLVLFLGRFSIAAIFWMSAQTKIEGFAFNFITGEFHLGIPHLSSSVVALFADEYRLPLISPQIAAISAAIGEHLFSILLLLGLASRFAALALLFMTATIEIFVFPDAYPTHGVWATVLLLIMLRGPGLISIDHMIKRNYAKSS